MCKVITVANQKGGVLKTTTAAVLGDLLSKTGKRVALIDMDSQANLTYNMGISHPDQLSITVANLLIDKANDEKLDFSSGIEIGPNLTLFPSNIELAGLEMSLINVFQREQLLNMIVAEMRNSFDFIIIDTSPSLGLLTINSLVAADEVVIPVQAQVFAIKGMEQLFKSISLAMRVNPKLSIAGFLITMVDGRSDGQKDTAEQLRDAFGSSVPRFDCYIPLQANGSEAAKEQQPLTTYSPNGTAASAYKLWLAEYLGLTLYQDCNEEFIEIGDVLYLGDNEYLVHFGEFTRKTKNNEMVKDFGIYLENMSYNGTPMIRPSKSLMKRCRRKQ